VDSRNSNYSSIDGVLFDKSQGKIVEFPGGIGGSYVVPSSVKTIAAGAFQNCANIENVSLPAGMTSLGGGAFAGCASLGDIVLPGSITNFGAYAFEACYGLTNAVIENGVTNIGSCAFYYCTALSDITIPESVVSIESNAFFECYSLSNLMFEGDAPASGAAAFSTYGFDTAYYLPGTSGWADFSTNTGVPTVLWNPVVQTQNGDFGLRSNQFGFDITGTPGIPLLIDACTNLANASWLPVAAVSLTNGFVHFSDPQWTNYQSRFYKIAPP
jgi:hypothetical protein